MVGHCGKDHSLRSALHRDSSIGCEQGRIAWCMPWRVSGLMACERPYGLNHSAAPVTGFYIHICTHTSMQRPLPGETVYAATTYVNGKYKENMSNHQLLVICSTDPLGTVGLLRELKALNSYFHNTNLILR